MAHTMSNESLPFIIYGLINFSAFKPMGWVQEWIRAYLWTRCA